MTAFNIVRMKVKAGFEKEFIEMNKDPGAEDIAQMMKNGFRRASIIKTGDRSYCFIGEWDSFDGIVKSRSIMIRNLDRYRDKLEDLGSGLGITDPVSGEVVAELGPP
ncbi:MAG TPA: DUF718 domain-containing protein [Bauldia sp.]|nr:DUF718 domain-containing protein [Bauldia sp.]